MVKKLSEKFQKGELIKKVLIGIGIGLAIGAVFTMPGVLLALKPFFGDKKISRQSFSKTYKILARKRFVKVREERGKYILEVTEEGKRQQKEYQLQDTLKDLKISIPKIWDRKWRLLVFDIPESKKEKREILRSFLQHFGFYQFQDSVFIHPFDCENEIDLLKEVFEIKPFVQCFTVATEKVPSRVAYYFSKLLSKYM